MAQLFIRKSIALIGKSLGGSRCTQHSSSSVMAVEVGTVA